MFIKIPKIDTFSLRLITFDQKWVFLSGFKILKKAIFRIFEDFDPPLKYTFFVESDQTQQKCINFGKFL